MEKQRRKVFDGRFVDVLAQDVKYPDGSVHPHELVDHPGAVAVLPIVDSEHIVMIRNYRFVVDQVLWELPAGIIEPGEELLVCAHRELLEETGYVAKTMEPLMKFYTTPGFCNEEIHVFVAKDLIFEGQKLEADEEIIAEILSWRQLLEMIRIGSIVDCKTISALLFYHTYYRFNSV